MLIKRRRGWELGENQATPESLYLQRRELVTAMGLGAVALAVPGHRTGPTARTRRPRSIPAKRNDKYGVPAPMTAEKLATPTTTTTSSAPTRASGATPRSSKSGPGRSR